MAVHLYSTPAGYSDYATLTAEAQVYGLKFTVSVNTVIQGLRVWRSSWAEAKPTHNLRLWNSSGTLLAECNTANEPANRTSGWAYGTFATPYTLVTGVTYVVSVYYPNADAYVYLWHGFDVGRTVAPFVMGAGAGVSSALQPGSHIYPTQTGYNNGEYFVDLIAGQAVTMAATSAGLAATSGTTLRTTAFTAASVGVASASATSLTVTRQYSYYHLAAETPGGASNISLPGGSYVAGTMFTAQVDMVVTQVRYWRVGTSPGTAHNFRVWTTGGVLLTEQGTSGESGAGWVIATLAAPLIVRAGSTILVSVFFGGVVPDYAGYDDGAYGVAATRNGVTIPAHATRTSSVLPGSHIYPTLTAYQDRSYYLDIYGVGFIQMPNGASNGAATAVASTLTTTRALTTMAAAVHGLGSVATGTAAPTVSRVLRALMNSAGAAAASRLTVSRPMASSAGGQATASGALATARPLASAVAGHGSVTAALAVAGQDRMAGGAYGIGGHTARLTASLVLASAPGGTSIASASLGGPRGLVGTSAGTASVAALIWQLFRVAAVANGSASVAATVQVTSNMAAVAVGTAHAGAPTMREGRPHKPHIGPHRVTASTGNRRETLELP